ncbi:bZIP transcription factor JlbA/IDI-4 [Aspergillus stella-maris]|uniref:bZIP transcription factor JlbA/IDI-4 n=1 Tax=Aspergillus stella-maris TaxID=1810926 RepID=UPI003CCD4817
MFPGDSVSSGFDQIDTLTATAGYPTSSTSADGIDWAALGCLPGSSNGLSEHPANSLGSQSQGLTPSVDSPDTPLDHHLTNPSTSHTTTTTTSTIHPTTTTSTSMPATTLPTPSASASRESSPKENPSRITKRQLNTMAARRYRQRRLDRMTQLEEELEAVKRERDELKMRVSKLEGETEALRTLVKDKK